MKKRGKAKSIPAKAMSIARDIARMERLDRVSLQHSQNIEIRHWGQTYVKDRLWEARDMIDDVGKARQRINRSDSRALRVLAAQWRHWDRKGLKWGERALEMASLGFHDFKDISRGSFRRWQERAAKLYPEQVTQI